MISTSRRPAALALALIAALLPARESRADEATPQRPSISFSAFTVPDRRWEVEAGGVTADGMAALPVFVKFGWSDRTELELGLDAVRAVETDDGVTASAGDLVFGLRSRVFEGGRSNVAVAGWIKAPTAVEQVGSEELDAGVIGIVSMPLGRIGIDANIWITGIGTEDTILGQVQGVATIGLPLGGCWSSFVEAAWQTTAASGGSGGFADGGIACTVAPQSVIDAAIGAGWSDGYPDWLLTAGWTLMLGGP